LAAVTGSAVVPLASLLEGPAALPSEDGASPPDEARPPDPSDNPAWGLDAAESLELLPPPPQAARARVARRAALMAAAVRFDRTRNMATPWVELAVEVVRVVRIPVRLEPWSRRSHPVVSKASRS
jgi:hypothetical protein